MFLINFSIFIIPETKHYQNPSVNQYASYKWTIDQSVVEEISGHNRVDHLMGFLPSTDVWFLYIFVGNGFILWCKTIQTWFARNLYTSVQRPPLHGEEDDLRGIPWSKSSAPTV